MMQHELGCQWCVVSFDFSAVWWWFWPETVDTQGRAWWEIQHILILISYSTNDRTAVTVSTSSFSFYAVSPNSCQTLLLLWINKIHLFLSGFWCILLLLFNGNLSVSTLPAFMSSDILFILFCLFFIDSLNHVTLHLVTDLEAPAPFSIKKILI